MSNKCYLCGHEAFVKKEVIKPISGVFVWCINCRTKYIIADGPVRQFCISEDDERIVKDLDGKPILDDNAQLIKWIRNEMKNEMKDETKSVIIDSNNPFLKSNRK